MPEGDDRKLRTLFVTYQADNDDAADTFMVVLGSIVENFRGVDLVEYQDDTVFAEGETAKTVLHQMATAAERLTPEQKAELDAFTQSLNGWTGEES